MGNYGIYQNIDFQWECNKIGQNSQLDYENKLTTY